MDLPKLEQILQHIEQHTGLGVEWVENTQHGDKNVDGKLIFTTANKGRIERFAEIKKEIRKHHVPQLKTLAENVGPVMLVAEKLYPGIKELLNEAGLDWMDGAGNIRLKDGDTLIWIDHHTTTPDNQTKNRAFTKTGLKVLFLFLHDEVWLNRTYRDIAETAGVALGNIKHVLDGLKEHDFLLAKNEDEYRLKNRDKLIDLWLTAFADELKPRIMQGRYRFADRTTAQQWKNLKLPGDTVWGGEPAADILTNDLKPGEFILYTTQKRAVLMKELKLAPDENGLVEVRLPYWTLEQEPPGIAPLLAVYTDLMLTGDPRNAAIAKRIYEENT